MAVRGYDPGDQVRLRVVWTLNPTSLAAAAAAGATTITVRDATGYAASDSIILEAQTDQEETATVNSVSGRVLTLSAGLIYAHAVNAEVGELAAPSTVTLVLETPDGVETSYTAAAATVTNVSTGIYRRDHSVTLAGLHRYRWVATGTVVAAEEGQFYVRSSFSA